LAGALLRAYWPGEEVERFVRAVCAAAGDGEVGGRVRAVADTAAKLKDGREASGWPTLANLLGSNGGAVVSAARGWLGIDTGARGTPGKPPPGPGPRRYAPLSPWVPFPTDVLPEPWRAFV